MVRSLIYSITFHSVLVLLTILSLPFMLREPIDLPPIVSVELIQITDKTSIPYAPKARKIIEKVAEGSATTSPEMLVERCLELMGPLPVKDKTKEELVDHATEYGDIAWDEDSYEDSAQKSAEMLALIASTREYQFG